MKKLYEQPLPKWFEKTFKKLEEHYEKYYIIKPLRKDCEMFAKLIESERRKK